MADSNIKDSCTSCLFFIEDGRMGTCKRYPTFLIKSPNEWCGEYKFDQVKADLNKAAQEAFIQSHDPYVTVPADKPKTAYDINTDQTVEIVTYNPEDAADALAYLSKALTAKPSPEPVKKPGRPKKVAK